MRGKHGKGSRDPIEGNCLPLVLPLLPNPGAFAGLFSQPARRGGGGASGPRARPAGPSWASPEDGGERAKLMYAVGTVMRSWLRIVLAVVTAGGVLAAPGAADAFCRSTTCRSTASKPCATDADECVTDGAKLYWTTSCVQFNMQRAGTQDLDPNDARDILQKSFRAWSEVDCGGGKIASMTFSAGPDIACKKSEYNSKGKNVNVILFQDDDWNYRGIDGTLAKTSVTYNDETGEIYDADIEVNAANNTLTITDNAAKVQYDLQAIMTHEVGHFLGIAHSPDPSASMYASYNPGSTSQRRLSPDDVKAVCAIYPPGRAARCDPEPRGGFSATCDGASDDGGGGVCALGRTPSEAALPLALTVLGLVGLRASRRRSR